MLDDLGLSSALRWYVDRLQRRSEMQMILVMPPGKLSLPADIEIACFRVAQEALTNVVRHANARNVLLQIQMQGSTLELAIKDDGDGFDLQAARAKALNNE